MLWQCGVERPGGFLTEEQRWEDLPETKNEQQRELGAHDSSRQLKSRNLSDSKENFD